METNQEHISFLNKILDCDHTMTEILQYMENTTEESWCMDVVKTEDNRSCFFGHLFDLGGNKLYQNFENVATEFMVYPVNDGKNLEYPQETPKQRCVAYLKDLISGKQRCTIQLMEEYENMVIPSK